MVECDGAVISSSLYSTLYTDRVRVILCSKRIRTAKGLWGGLLSLSYPRRLKCRTICRCLFKRRPLFSSVLLRKESDLLLGRPVRVQESSKWALISSRGLNYRYALRILQHQARTWDIVNFKCRMLTNAPFFFFIKVVDRKIKRWPLWALFLVSEC